MALECRRKQEHPEKTHEGTLKFTTRVKPRTFLPTPIPLCKPFQGVIFYYGLCFVRSFTVCEADLRVKHKVYPQIQYKHLPFHAGEIKQMGFKQDYWMRQIIQAEGTFSGACSDTTGLCPCFTIYTLKVRISKSN